MYSCRGSFSQLTPPLFAAVGDGSNYVPQYPIARGGLVAFNRTLRLDQFTSGCDWAVRLSGRRLGPSREAIQFLREEFSRPLDVHEFASSVPLGMEQQVYTMSLIAIDLDTGREAKYLLELARSLRIPDEVREQIHQRLGAPSVY